MTDHTKSAGEVEARDTLRSEIAHIVASTVAGTCCRKTGGKGGDNARPDCECLAASSDIMMKLDAYLAKLTSTKPEPSRIVEIRERQKKRIDVLRNFVPPSKSWPSTASLENVAVAYGFAAQEIDDLLSHITAIEAENVALREDVQRTERENDEAYELGKADGRGAQTQEIDIATGGDGEYRWSDDPERCVESHGKMKANIVARFRAIEADLNDYKHWADDVRHLTRLLDIELNGDNAAKQASLCDLIGSIKPLKDDKDRLTKALARARTYVEMSYDENGGEEAAEAEHDLKEIDLALSPPSTSQSEGEG